MSKIAAVGFGRLNPPTCAHEMLVNKLAEQDADSKLFLSHSQDAKKNPLSYEDKLFWCDKAFGELVEVVESDARNMYEALTELYKEGYTDIIYVCGSDRIAEAENLKKYNGIPDRNGNLLYKFNSLEPVQVGNDRMTEDVDITKVSASMQRKYAAENDFDSFKQGCPSTLSEEDCKDLFNDVRMGMGLNESLNESTLNEDAKSEFKKSLKNKLLKYNLGNMDPDSRHIRDNEILRIKTQSSGYDESSIIDIIKKSLNELNKEFPELQIHPGNYRKFFSHLYNSLEISTVEGVYYVTIATSSKKLYTPNKVCKRMINSGIAVNYLELDQYIDNINDVNFKLLYDESIKGVSSANAKDFINVVKGISNKKSNLEFKSAFDKTIVENIDDKDIPNILNDFGEVLGAGCLAGVLSKSLNDTAFIKFPSAANEKLIDYTIVCKRNNYKVSEKAGQGASPSCESALSFIVEDAIGTSRADKFITWMYNNVAKQGVSIHDGYVNMANLVASGKDKMFIENDLYNAKKVLSYALMPGSITHKNIDKFMNDCRSIYNSSRLEYDSKRIGDDNYCETLRIRYLARSLILNINSDDYLIEEFNTRLKSKLGLFIQVYLKSSKEEFKEGLLKFNAVTLSENSGIYKFSDGSAINQSGFLSNKKLGIKIYH